MRNADETLFCESAISSAESAIYVKSLDGEILSWNPACVKLYGYTAEEAVGQPVSLIVPRDKSDEIEQIHGKIRNGENISILETERVRKDGTRITVSLMISPVRESGGEIIGSSVIATDITEKARLEQEMREMLSFQRAILDSTGYAIIAMTKDGIISLLNRTAEKLFGIAAADVIGSRVRLASKVIDCATCYTGPPPDSLTRFHNLMSSMDFESEHKFEWNCTHKDMNSLLLQIHVSHMYGPEDRHYGHLLIGHDVSRTVEAERAERYRKARMQAIVDTAADAIITIDEQGVIESFNKAAERIFGYTAGEVIGQDAGILMPPPHSKQHKSYIDKYLRTGISSIIGFGRELTARRRNGEEFPIDLSLSEVRLDDKRIFTGIVRDITDRKEMERLKNEFVSTVSHELRTPLTSIRGSLGLLTGGVICDFPDDAKELLNVAKNNTDRLMRLINDILDIEKIESGSIGIEPVKTDLSGLTARSIEEMAGFASECNVTLIDETPAIHVIADSDQILQVLDNLVSNAVKFSRPGAAVKISARADNGVATVSVHDDGPGIPDEFKSKIFQKFQQADASVTRKKGDTGLGLAISKAIVENHGGEISFVSDDTTGTTFSFTLSLAKDG